MWINQVSFASKRLCRNYLVCISQLSRSIVYYQCWKSQGMYVLLAKTVYSVLRKSGRIPIFLHRKSNHIFTAWQHIVLLTIKQYEGKSYRMFAEWLGWLKHIISEFFYSYPRYLILWHSKSSEIGSTMWYSEK